MVTNAGIEGLAFLFGGLESKVIKYLIAYHQGYVLWFFAFEGRWKQKQVLKDWPFYAKAWKGKSLELHDFTGEDMKIYIGKKGRYLGLPFLFGGQGKV